MKDPSKLTTKRELFIQNIIGGMSQRQAYIKAGYKTKNKPPEYIDTEACKLFKNPKIIHRYNELMEKTEKKAIWTREMALEELKEMLADSKKDKHYGGRQGAIKELNQLCDLYPKENKQKDEPTTISFNIESVKVTNEKN